jgi:hypothetical protein
MNGYLMLENSGTTNSSRKEHEKAVTQRNLCDT